MTAARLGRQGGDQRDRSDIRLDLSTCVNPYGPPPQVMAAIRSVSEMVVRAHPYDAAADVERLYAGHLGRPAGEFVAGRGTSEFIWILAREMRRYKVGLPLPTYSEFRRAFKRANTYGGGPCTHPVETLHEAMRNSDAVILSNPHNPTGQIIDRQILVDLAINYPSKTLVVDESYIDFLADGDTVTLIGCPADNIIVLRSPSKFYGLAGIRSGVAWSRQPLRRKADAWRTPWPVSALAAEVLKQALSNQLWAEETRGLLAGDVAWLETILAESELGFELATGLLHFRLATGSATFMAEFANLLQTHRVLVRVLEDGHGIGRPAVRIAAPRQADRWVLAGALGHST